MRKFSPFRQHLLALALYLAATVIFTWPLAANLTTAIPGDSFDGWQNYWNQWWLKQALLDRLANPLVTDLLYYPTGVSLYFHTLNPFNGVTTLPIQLAFGLIAAYNAVVFLSWVLAGYGMFLLARWVIGGEGRGARGESSTQGRKDAEKRREEEIRVDPPDPRHPRSIERRGARGESLTQGHKDAEKRREEEIRVDPPDPRHPRSIERRGARGESLTQGHKDAEKRREEEIRVDPPDPRHPRSILFIAPFVAGLVYTLSPFHMAHLLGHMQVMSLQWMPFYILALLRSLQPAEAGRPWQRAALWAGFFLILTGLSDWYFVLYLFLFTAVTLLWHWAAPPGRFGWRKLGRVLAPPLVAGLFFAGALSFWLVPMVLEATRFRFMVRPAADLYILSASVMDFLVPNRLHTLFRPDSFTWIGNQIAPVSERTLAIGYTALALAVAALALAWRKAAFWWVMALFFFVLALGPQWHWGDITWADIPAAALNGEELASWTPYGLLNQLVPFMRISRSVSRFAVMVQLCMAVLAGIGLWRLLTMLRNSLSQYVVSAFVIAALLFEYWVAPYPLSPPDTPAWYAELAADPDPRAVLNLPMNYDRPGYLLYQTVHGKPLTVAYISRDDPRTLTERTPVLQHFRHLGPDILAVDPAQVAGTVFADLGVGTVVLDRYKMPGGDERTYTEALAAAIFAGQTPIFEDERITVYKTPPVEAPQPYLMLGALDWGPLEGSEGEASYRTLLGDRAEVIVLHPPAAGTLTLRYTSDAPITVSIVLAGDDTVLATSAGATGEVRVDLAEAQRVAHTLGLPESPLSLRIEVDGEAAVRVEEITLDR